MKKLYCVICGKFENSKKSYLSEKILVLSIICKNEKYLKKKNQFKY